MKAEAVHIIVSVTHRYVHMRIYDTYIIAYEIVQLFLTFLVPGTDFTWKIIFQ